MAASSTTDQHPHPKEADILSNSNLNSIVPERDIILTPISSSDSESVDKINNNYNFNPVSTPGLAKYFRSFTIAPAAGNKPKSKTTIMPLIKTQSSRQASHEAVLLYKTTPKSNRISGRSEDRDTKITFSEDETEPIRRSNYLPSYEYPGIVKSMKSVYKEMFITTSLYLLNIISAVGIVLINKYIYTFFKFKYGVVLTFYHFALTSLGLHLLAAFKLFQSKPVNILQVFPVSISFCAYVLLTNLSLQYNSGTFYQILVVPTIALLQYLLYGIKTESTLLPSMIIMLIGVGIATMTELKPSLVGLITAFSGIFMTAIYQILVGVKQKQLGLNAIQLLHYQAPVSATILLIATPFFTSIKEIISFPYSADLVVAIIASALCAFFLNLSMYLVLGRSTALTYNVIGLSKLFLVLLLNYLIFELTSVSGLNIFGVLVAFIGVCSFSVVKFRSMTEVLKRDKLDDVDRNNDKDDDQ